VTTTLKKYNIEGKEIGTVKVDPALVDAEAHGQSIKDYIVAIRKNARQWSASTKTRSEVDHTTKKPRPQKGSGNARQGTLVAPQFRGGGIVFGPKPKFDQHVRINKKERKAAIRALISERIRNGDVLVLETTKVEQPKTKVVAGFLKALQLKKRVLFIGEGIEKEIEVEGMENTQVSLHTAKHELFIKSMRNIQKTEFRLAKNISGYDVMVANHLILTEEALKEIVEWLR